MKKIVLGLMLAAATYSCSETAVAPTDGDVTDSSLLVIEGDVVDTTEDGDIIDRETGNIIDKESGEVVDQDSSLIIEEDDIKDKDSTEVDSTEIDPTETDSTEIDTTEVDSIENEEGSVPDPSLYPDWTADTHEKLSDPNYAMVFPQGEVLRFDINITDDNWDVMQTDLADNLGSTGGRPGAGGLSEDYDPIWVPCSFEFDGKEWYDVGVRFKGNSSLQSAYSSGNGKLSFKLDFDEFEEETPAINNQRFYGFKQLNLNNNYNDGSLMREKVGADVFREFGMVAARTAYCVVYVNNGSGDSQFYGVYTIVEEVDNTVLDDQLGDDSGNLYKPDGDAATFAEGSYDDGEMEKKSNEDIADYSDVIALYNVINSDTRTSDVDQWKTDLEEVFDVDNFMKYLAVNNTIQNWDTYGRMTHNYFLYNSHITGKLTWIPWDNNEAFDEGKMGGALSLSMDDVGNDWPLISYLIAIPEYEAIYEAYLEEFTTTVFTEAKMNAKYETFSALIQEYAYQEESGYTYVNNFDSDVSTIKSHASSRITAVNDYLK